MSAKAEATALLDEDLVITFKRPIEGPGDPVSQIVIREPLAFEIEQWDSLAGAAADIKAISVIAGVPEATVRKMPARDFYLAARRIGAFLS